MYAKNTVYVIGHGKLVKKMLLRNNSSCFFIGFVINVETDEVVDISCASTISTTEKFIASILLDEI